MQGLIVHSYSGSMRRMARPWPATVQKRPPGSFRAKLLSGIIHLLYLLLSSYCLGASSAIVDGGKVGRKRPQKQVSDENSWLSVLGVIFEQTRLSSHAQFRVQFTQFRVQFTLDK